MQEWVSLLGGGILLYLGAEWFVGGASSLALSLRVPQILIGLTVVAYGTSAPEVIVGIEAASSGRGAVALGNVVGSNIANIGLILGVASLVRPAKVDVALRGRELPMLAVSAGLLPLLLWDGRVSAFEACALLLVALVYTGVMVHSARGATALQRATEGAREASITADEAGAPSPSKGWLRAAITAVAGLAILLVGGNLFVDGAVTVAQSFGMSDRVVGLTIVAIGTSLPELVTSVIAALRGHSDIAIGNVVGSNIFNVFLCLGAAGLAGPITASNEAIALDLATLFLMTALLALYLRGERFVTRVEGGLVLGLFTAFMVMTIAKG